MANYSLTVDNRRYDPTAWLNIVGENLAAAKQEHRAAEAAYGELASKADMFEKLAHDVQGTDSQAYQDYMNYANTLRQHTDMLATQGVNPALWRNLLQAKNDYSRIISPIEEAYAARDKEAERQAKYLEQHPTAIFEKDARDMGIDQWLKNPHYRAKSYDLEKVAERAKERYTALQKQVMQMVSMNNIDPMKMSVADIKKWVKVAGVPYLYESMETGGVNPEEVRKFMMGDKSTLASILRPIAQETLGMYSMGDWNTDYDHYTAEQNQLRRDTMNNQMISTVVGEAPNSIGNTVTKQYTDTESVKWAQLAEQKREFDINDEWRRNPNNPANQKKGSGGSGSDEEPPKVYTFYNTQDVTDVNKDIETTKADNLRLLTDLIKFEPRLDEYDYKDLMNAFKKVYGDGASDMVNTLKERPELAENVANELFKKVSSDGILTRGREEGYEYMIPFTWRENHNTHKNNLTEQSLGGYDNLFSKEEKEDNSDVNVENNDYSKLTNGQLYNVYNYYKKQVVGTTSGYVDNGNVPKGQINKFIEDNPDTWNSMKSIIDEILERKKDGRLKSRTQKDLEKLINYKDDSDLSVYGATDDYIGDAALTSTISNTNYEGQSAKVFMDKFAEIVRLNPKNTGVTLEGKKQNLEDLSTLLSMNDKTGDYYYTPQFYLKPVKDKDGKWSHKFGFNDKNGKWYDVSRDFFAGVTKNARKTALANMDDYLNKMRNYKLTEKDKEAVDSAVDNYFKQIKIDNPTKKQRAVIRDMYVRQLKEQVAAMYKKSYEENRANFWGHLFDETHNTNFMGTIAEANTNKTKVDPEYNYGQTGQRQ